VCIGAMASIDSEVMDPGNHLEGQYRQNFRRRKCGLPAKHSPETPSEFETVAP